MEVPFFKSLNVVELNPANFENTVMKKDGVVKCVFFWGYDCPNCDQAKKILNEESERVRDFDFEWFHVNAYEHMELAKSFGLYGIPVFMFFYDGKNQGRITTFPGMDDFIKGVAALKAKLGK